MGMHAHMHMGMHIGMHMCMHMCMPLHLSMPLTLRGDGDFEERDASFPSRERSFLVNFASSASTAPAGGAASRPHPSVTRAAMSRRTDSSAACRV